MYRKYDPVAVLDGFNIGDEIEWTDEGLRLCKDYRKDFIETPSFRIDKVNTDGSVWLVALDGVYEGDGWLHWCMGEDYFKLSTTFRLVDHQGVSEGIQEVKPLDEVLFDELFASV